MEEGEGLRSRGREKERGTPMKKVEEEEEEEEERRRGIREERSKEGTRESIEVYEKTIELICKQ